MSVNYDWQSVFLFLEPEAQLRVRVTVGLWPRLGSGLELGLGTSDSFIAHCRQETPGY